MLRRLVFATIIALSIVACTMVVQVGEDLEVTKEPASNVELSVGNSEKSE